MRSQHHSEPEFPVFGNTAMQLIDPTPSRAPLSLDICEDDWEPVAFADASEELPTQLLTTVYVNGCPMHFEAYLVDVADEFFDPRHQAALNEMKQALGDHENWSTIRYGDNAYAVIAIPFGKGT